jgi:site-specific recombinase XerC
MPEELRTIDRTLSADAKERLRAQASAWRAKHCWSPNQLRHAAATAIRRKFGLEAAQVILGHSELSTTQVYAERDLTRAAAVIKEIG